MKKTFPPLLLAAVLTAVLLLGACAGRPAPSAAEPEYRLTGLVQEVTKDIFSLTADEDGLLYTFAWGTATVEAGTRGLLPGDGAEVYYTGALQPGLEEGVQPVTVTRVTLTAEVLRGVQGVITALEADLLDMDTTDGDHYQFIIGQAELDTGGKNLLVGDTVTVTYVGELDPTLATQTVGVRKVAVTAQMEESVSGVVVDATLDSLRITTTDGIRYAFNTTGATIIPGDNGLILGDVARVWYSGALKPADAVQPVTVNTVEVTMAAPKPGSNSGSSATSASSSSGGGTVWSTPSGSSPVVSGNSTIIPDGDLTEHFISGTVVTADSKTLELSSGGFTYLFGIAGATISGGADGLQAGESVAVFYYGTLDPLVAVQDVIVTRVSVTGWSGNAVRGAVTEFATPNLTIKSTDGKTYRFNIRNAEVETDADGLVAGDAVTVYYTGTLDSTKEDQTVSVSRVVEH